MLTEMVGFHMAVLIPDTSVATCTELPGDSGARLLLATVVVAVGVVQLLDPAAETEIVEVPLVNAVALDVAVQPAVLPRPSVIVTAPSWSLTDWALVLAVIEPSTTGPAGALMSSVTDVFPFPVAHAGATGAANTTTPATTGAAPAILRTRPNFTRTIPTSETETETETVAAIAAAAISEDRDGPS